MTDAIRKATSLAGGEAVFWGRLAWPQIEALAREGAQPVLLPLGATEQHGPHLPVNVDSVFAESFCAYASARTGVPVLPTITYGCSLGHTDRWAGTLSLDSSTLIATIRHIARFVMSAGFNKLLLVNSHWGNVASARCAIDEIRFEHHSRFSIGLKSTFDVTPSVWAQFTDDANDFHANRAETALMMCLDPTLVRTDLLTDADDPDRTAGKVFTYVVPQTSRNGVTGFPSRATPEDGRKLFIEIGDALTDLVRAARNENPLITEQP